MKEQDCRVDAEEYVLAQHFRVPVLEVEGFVWNHGRIVDGGGTFVIRSIRAREVRESGDADRRRVAGWSNRERRSCICPWNGKRFR